jgi:hypothetical protein
MNDKDLTAKLDAFKIVNDHYRNDFQLFWQRTNFFLLADSGLLGFFVSKVLDHPVSSQSFSVLACVSGALLSIIWLLVSLSSIYWIDTWRRQVIIIDADVNPYRSFSVGEELDTQQQWFRQNLRPEVVSAWLPVLFFVVWIFLAYFLFHRELVS